MVTLNLLKLHVCTVCTYVCTYTLKRLSLTASLFSLTSPQTNMKLSQIGCEPTPETVDCGRNLPGRPDSGIAEVHRPKKIVGAGSRVKAQSSKSTPSSSISKSAPERRPTVESVEKSGHLETGSSAQNVTMTANVSPQKKHSDYDAFKDQSNHVPCLQKASKSKLPKRTTTGGDVMLTAPETVLTNERVECKARKQAGTKESSKSEAKGSQPLSKDRAPIKIAEKVDKKHRKEKNEDYISNTSGAGKEQESGVKTAQPVDKYPKDNKVRDHEESKVSLASNSPSRGKNCDITTTTETDGPKTPQSQDSEPQERPKIEPSLQVPKGPKTGKLMFALKWPMWLKVNEMSFL